MSGRRHFLSVAALAGAGLIRRSWAASLQGASKTVDSSALTATLSRLEADIGGRLGVSLVDTAGGRHWGYRADERFPMCSTFKFLAAAAVLRRVDEGKEQLARRIVYRQQDLVPYSPTTGKHTGGDGLSLAQLCEAAITLSDNTAANLMLESMDGPAGMTRFVRSLGDDLTRLDRNEPTLNEAVPGDPRDTTTPAAMTADLRQLVLGNALTPASRQQLAQWLVANQTGNKRVRAGLPKGWKVGDKTGTGRLGTANDVGVVWTEKGAPLLFAVYLTENAATDARRDAVHAEVGRLIGQLMM
ncbi:class A beta-lactamase [Herbaspirillum huttiense]|uniref:Beta-lactamase n=1 Tax=Herbaspirillum huttiense subsp. lycopersici TaxID=3074428 RepID=A0ABU2ESH3_9BURK|nr:class A beta-lactamase [Herbaspirillum huttiense]MDR9850672.1 class A beta-lactamase [Herbaspirillum huttiense SE1]